MSAVVKRKVESRFARRASMGRGIGLDEAVASAEARLERMGASARQEITAMLDNLQQLRGAIAARDGAATDQVWVQADSLAGLAGVFGMPEVGQVAKSLCQLFDAAAPTQPNADALRVHLDALQMFQSLKLAAINQAAPVVLQGLVEVIALQRRRKAQLPTVD